MVDWRSLKGRGIRDRLESAFNVVEREYGVTRLLDPEGKTRRRTKEIKKEEKRKKREEEEEEGAFSFRKKTVFVRIVMAWESVVYFRGHLDFQSRHTACAFCCWLPMKP